MNGARTLAVIALAVCMVIPGLPLRDGGDVDGPSGAGDEMGIMDATGPRDGVGGPGPGSKGEVEDAGGPDRAPLPGSFGDGGGAGEAASGPRRLDTSSMSLGPAPGWGGDGVAPTATNQDSSGNDDFQYADTIQPVSGSIAFGGCSLNTQSDPDDYFKIFLSGGKLQTDRLELTFMRTPPYTGMYLQAAVHIMDTVVTNANYNMDYVYNGSFSLLDQDNQTTLRMNAQHTGWYYIRFGAIKNPADPHYTAYYRVEAHVTTMSHPATSFSNETSPDPDIGNCTSVGPSNLLTNRRVVQDFDHWDWYNISVPNADHRTDLQVNITVTNTYSGTSKYARPCQTETYVLLAGATTQGLVVMDAYSMVGTGTFNIHNSTRVSEYFIGLCANSVFIQTGQTYLCAPNGWAVYGFDDVDVKEIIPNLRPRLSGAMVTPGSGDYHDGFDYNVTYVDVDNTKDPVVNLSIDGGAPIELDQLDPGDSDYSDGAVFYYNTTGAALTDTPVPHNFQFTAMDGKNMEASGDNGTHIGPTILNNEAPYVLEGADDKHQVYEDSGDSFIDLNAIFTDDDIVPRADYLYFSISENGEEWTTAVHADKVNFTVDNMNQQLKVTTNQDKHGLQYLWINVTDSHQYFMDPPFNLTVDVLPVNDRPRFTHVQGEAIASKEVALDIDPVEDQWFNITVDAFDIDGDTLQYECDIDDAMDDMDLGETFDFDSATGELSFKPQNDHAGQSFTLRYEVKDAPSTGTVPLSNTVDVSFFVWNSPDRPHISVPGKRSVDQDDILDFSVSGSDPDLAVDDDEELVFSTDAGDHFPEKDHNDDYGYTFDPESGRFVLWPDNWMVGVYDVGFTVKDAAGASDTGTVTVTVENVNDPPTAAEFAAEVVKNQLNVTCVVTEEAADIDMDEAITGKTVDPNERLTYSYDFGYATPRQSIDSPSSPITHMFPQEGSYTITLIVSDRSGELAETTQEVTVERPPATTYTVTIVVKDMDSEAFLSQAEVRMVYGPDDFYEVTDANGEVEIIGIRLHREYTLNITVDGYHPHEEPRTFTTSGDVVTIRMTPEDQPPPDDKEPPAEEEPAQRASQPTTKFPWWIIILVIAIVIAAAVAVGIYANKKKKEREEEEERRRKREDDRMAEEAAARVAAQMAAMGGPPGGQPPGAYGGAPAGGPPPGGPPGAYGGSPPGGQPPGAYGGAPAGGAPAGGPPPGGPPGAYGGPPPGSAAGGAMAPGGAQAGQIAPPPQQSAPLPPIEHPPALPPGPPAGAPAPPPQPPGAPAPPPQQPGGTPPPVQANAAPAPPPAHPGAGY